MKHASQRHIKHGNLQNIKSDVVVRKVRSEKLSQLDRHKDDIIDLILMQNEKISYIKFVGQPMLCLYLVMDNWTY